jgi:hypothetical protein
VPFDGFHRAVVPDVLNQQNAQDKPDAA